MSDIDLQLAAEVMADEPTYKYLTGCALLGTAVKTLLEIGRSPTEILEACRNIVMLFAPVNTLFTPVDTKS